MAAFVAIAVFLCMVLFCNGLDDPPYTIRPPNYLVMQKDPKQILGTTIWSTTEEIRENFRSFSKVYYGTDDFDSMIEAYRILTDAKLRKIYEKGGFESLWGYDQPKFEDALRDPFEISSQFDTGSFSLKFGFKEGEEKKSPTVTHNLKLPLENFITGTTITIAIVRKEICGVCNGTGGAVAAELLTCPTCKGKKTHSTHAEFKGGWKQTFTRACKHCDGTGQVASVPCPHCGGARVVDGKKDVTITLEPGTPESHPFEFIGEAEQVPGAAPGNVIITVNSKPHPLFQREGSDLVINRNITLMQALMGFEMPVQTIDGRTIIIQRDEVSKPGTVHEIEGEGLPVFQVPKEKGKLKIKLNIVFPERIAITDEKKQALRNADIVKKKKKGGEGGDSDDSEEDDEATQHQNSTQQASPPPQQQDIPSPQQDTPSPPPQQQDIPSPPPQQQDIPSPPPQQQDTPSSPPPQQDTSHHSTAHIRDEL